jgi:hypothetical protein
MPTLQGNPKQIDHSTIPPAVRRAAEEAERLQREASGQSAPQPAQDAPGEPAAPQEPPRPTNPEPAPQPAQADAQQPQPTHPQPDTQRGNEPEDPNSESWKAKFESENGRVRKLNRQVAEMSSRLANMETLLASVQATTAAAPAPELSFEKLLTPEEEQEWGEVLPVIKKQAQEIIAPLQAELQAKIKQLDERLQGLGQSQQVDAKSRMLQVLDNHPVIGASGSGRFWRDVNNDPVFAGNPAENPDDPYGWLMDADRYSGQPRVKLLREAFNSNDAARVAAFFEDFLKEVAPAPAPQSGAQPTPTPPGKVPLGNLAAPGRAQRSAAPATGPADKPLITTGDITAFYAARTAGRYKGREAEADAFEKDIFAAQKENRVVTGPPSH